MASSFWFMASVSSLALAFRLIPTDHGEADHEATDQATTTLTVDMPMGIGRRLLTWGRGALLGPFASVLLM